MDPLEGQGLLIWIPAGVCLSLIALGSYLIKKRAQRQKPRPPYE